MSNLDLHDDAKSIVLLCQNDDETEQITQFYTMRKLLAKKGESYYSPIAFQSMKDYTPKNDCALFLHGDIDCFQLEIVQRIVPFISPFNIAFFRSIESTQKFLLDFDGPTSNLVCVADIQTEGRGRWNRKWESPLGCLMFSIKVPVFDNHLYDLSPHISALAMVLALESIPQFKQLAFRIRWPYDVVIKDGTKLCGIINEPFQGYDTSYSVIGMGLHVNNMNTTCLKSLIKSDAYISRAFILSTYLLQFCMLLHIYDKQGFEGIAPIYYAHWENYHQTIDIGASGEAKEKVLLIGITNDGYLKGEDTHKKLLELYPDRNCEDSLANLIAHTFYYPCKKHILVYSIFHSRRISFRFIHRNSFFKDFTSCFLNLFVFLFHLRMNLFHFNLCMKLEK